MIRALLSGAVTAVRQNKLAAALSLLAFLSVSYLAVNSRYDERPRYRELILPNIQRAEANFTASLYNAEHAPNDLWRLHYFLTAHLKVKDVLKAARERYPTTTEGIAAHENFIRYYVLVNEELSIIRTEMSIDEEMDYWSEWNREKAELDPIRENWQSWVNGD